MIKWMKKKKAAKGSHDQTVENDKQTLLTHLLAMRKLLIFCVAAVGVGFVVSFYFLCEPIMDYILQPLLTRNLTIITTGVSESFVTKLKISLIAGVVISSPFIFFQIWLFIKPALYEDEIRVFRVLFFVALMLFLVGICFCYSYVYELAINFFLSEGSDSVTPALSLAQYYSFLLSFLLPFGVVFELPVAIYIAARKGWVNYQKLAKNRKYIFFGIFVLAAVLTPPDVISQVMLGIPMYLLYEISVQIARFVKPHTREVSAASETTDATTT